MENLPNHSTMPMQGQTEGKPTDPVCQQWLLLAALALGLMGDWLIHADNGLVQWLFWAFWAVYSVAFYLLNGKSPCPYGAKGTAGTPLYRAKAPWLLAGAATIAGLLSALRGAAYSASPYSYGLEALTALNWFVIPCIWMLHKAFSVSAIERGQEWTAIKPFFRGFFVEPFLHIGRFFGAMGSLFCKKAGKTSGGILLGLAIGIPLSAVVLMLLTSADVMMARLVDGWLGAAEPWMWIRRGSFVVLVGMLFYSFLYDTAWGKRPPMGLSSQKSWPQGAMLVPVILLCAVYGVFAYVQFQYFFGGKLPATLTYSAYAREGFGQLIAVSLINFTVVGLTVLKTGPTRGSRVLCLVLIALTGLLLYSAFLRLKLYIDTYGLTMMRILPLWLMGYLGVLAVLTGIRLFTEKLRLVAVAGAIGVVWYVALNVPNWAAIIAGYQPMV